MSGVSFTAGTLSTITDCVTHVESNLNRGTIGASSKPTSTEVQRWLIQAKQELMEFHGFTWRRVFSYADTSAGEYRYALPLDFGEGGHVIRDTTNDVRITQIDPVSFDSIFVDVAGDSSSYPEYYTIKDRELWLSQPASGTYRLELEYLRTGDDTSATDISYLPELMRFRICDYATYRAFLVLELYNSATAYKDDWLRGISQSKKRDNRKRWSATGYKTRPWFV